MESKDAIRKAASAARRQKQDKDVASRRIIERVFETSPYQTATCVLWYVDARDEVRTRHALPSAIAESKRTVVPYCEGESLRLFELREMSDLDAGRFGILEPKSSLRGDQARQISAAEIDLALIPGVAFDSVGGRLGHGRGYYDRLLGRPALTMLRVGLAFECQLFPRIPVEDHDVSVDWVVTEDRVLDCRRQLGLRAEGPAC